MKLLLEQIRYNQWAILQFIEAIKQLEQDQFNGNMKSSFSSIHETLGHMIWVEELWLERWQGHLFNQIYDSINYPTLEYIAQRFMEVYSKQNKFLESYMDDPVNQLISYVNFNGEIWNYSILQMVQHLVFHSSFHRGQLATMLRQLGKIPPKTDYLIYVDEQSSSTA